MLAINLIKIARLRAEGTFGDLNPTQKVEMYELSKKLHTLDEGEIWPELKLALATKDPSVFFDELAAFDVFPIWAEMCATRQRVDHHPEIFVGKHIEYAMRYAVESFNNTMVTFAVFCHDFGKPECYRVNGNALNHEIVGLSHIEDFCDRFSVPDEYRELALLSCKLHIKVSGILGMGSNQARTPKTLYKLLEETNALEDDTMLRNILKVCLCDIRGRGVHENDFIRTKSKKSFPQVAYILKILKEAKRAKETSSATTDDGLRQDIVRAIKHTKENYVDRERCPVNLLNVKLVPSEQ